MIQISVNNNSQKIESNTSLGSLLDALLPNSNGTAIALNEKVIPKTEWNQKILTENDKILIITATQGG